ncbi:hypothetical protein DVH24_030348 [Malus domestica]|uniref:Uncharacterized protein n=1 Tax=Malus domestica TaxID=3750 RepID=A0A498K2N7_MALDO|nr:hypothetical protein DVH24_030348 [Malus domestica]
MLHKSHPFLPYAQNEKVVSFISFSPNSMLKIVGVARFFRAKSAFWSDEVMLLVTTEEGFTLILDSGNDLRSFR